MRFLAVLAAALLGAVALFQLALAAGAPLGAYAWGGRHPGPLPARLRLGSAAAVAVLVLFAVILLARASFFGPGWAEAARGPAYAVAGFLTLNSVANFASPSARERWAMGPLALATAAIAWVLAALG